TAGEEPEYRNAFTAIPSRIPLTPHRETPWPHVAGAQVGIIAGPAGEEIHCDKFGRIKLWFPWDRRAKKDGSDTVWVRVSQNWAGGGWGGQIIPRIGMEAMVAFVNGDPDQPLVTSLVPNPNQKVPYTLPANKTKSVFRTKTYKSETKNDYNELRFDDATGMEEVRITSQKDMNKIVHNHDSSVVVGNQVASVFGDRLHETLGHECVNVGRSLTISTGPSLLASSIFHIVGNFAQKMSLGGYTIESAKMARGGDGDLNLSAENNLNISVGSSLNEFVKENQNLNIGKNASTFVRDDATWSVGKSLNFSVGRVALFKFEDSVVFSCGKSRIRLTKDGEIEISGKSLKLAGTERIELN
ncbi:type VI secretion system tip protein VgrG, partial [Jiella sp. CQZ9-1]